MAGKSAVVASDDQRDDLSALASSRDLGEADRARAVLLTLAGWTRPDIPRRSACARIRSASGTDFAAGRVAALKTRIARARRR